MDFWLVGKSDDLTLHALSKRKKSFEVPNIFVFDVLPVQRAIRQIMTRRTPRFLCVVYEARTAHQG